MKLLSSSGEMTAELSKPVDVIIEDLPMVDEEGAETSAASPSSSAASTSNANVVAAAATSPVAAYQPQQTASDEVIDLSQEIEDLGRLQAALEEMGRPELTTSTAVEVECPQSPSTSLASSSRQMDEGSSPPLPTRRLIRIPCPADGGPTPFTIQGGSAEARLISVELVRHTDLVGILQPSDVILTVDDLPVSGKLRSEVVSLIDGFMRTREQIALEVVSGGSIPDDLCEILADRKWGDLQTVIRDNVYTKTVPYTTRPPREGEIDGEHYSFVTVEEFQRLQKSGQLLEHGSFQDHFYGTPRPLEYEPEAMRDTKGPLPPNWEIGYSEHGEKYFIDHNTGTTQWNDPRDLPNGWEEVNDPQYGTFYVDHINKRTQYERPTVDHLSGPSSSKSYQGTSGAPPPRHQPAYSTSYHSNGHQPNGGHNGQAIYQHANGFSNGESGYGSGGGHPIPAPPANSSQVMFTRDPSKLRGELLTTRLVKGPKGLGFTLIGNDASSRGDEFIQIKSILPHGPAAADRTLHPGDVLVYVNNDCVLGASQSEACRIFLGIPIGDTVTLQVCRGYPLLLDPANRIVTENVYSQATNGQRSREVFDIDVIKGVDGFGFTIADGITGQRVRKILYPDQCPNLLEGDVILEMDGQNVRSMPHTQLVDKLRECSVGHRAHLVVKRASPRHRSRTPTAAFRYGESRQTPVAVAPRSKTPAPHNSNHSSSQQPTLQYQPRSLNALPPRNSDWAPPPARPSQPLPIVTSGYRPTVSTNTAPRPQGVDLYENVSRIRPSSTTLGFATPNYVPLSAFAQPEKPVGQEYITVNLIRKPSGFGFRLLGGVETNTFLTVGQIVQGGAAADDGRLREGDEIVEIDGRNVEGASHAEAVSILEHAAQAKHVKLVVRRARSEITRSSSLPATEQQRNGLAQVSSTYDVVLNREDNDGFGFIIISSINRNGSTIGQIMESSPAAKCGRLSVGDRVVAVNGIDILSLSHGEIVNLIKASGTSVRLTIGPPAAEREMSVDKPSPTRNITTTTTNIQTTFPASSSVPKTNGFTPASTYEPFVQPTPIPIQNGGSGINGGRSSTYGYASQDEHSTSQLITVELKRGERGFGFSIRGGQEFGAMPVFVLRIADDGPAAKDSRLRVGDQLVEINGRDTHGLTHQEAIDLIKQYPTVRLVVRRHQLRT